MITICLMSVGAGFGFINVGLSLSLSIAMTHRHDFDVPGVLDNDIDFSALALGQWDQMYHSTSFHSEGIL